MSPWPSVSTTSAYIVILLAVHSLALEVQRGWIGVILCFLFNGNIVVSSGGYFFEGGGGTKTSRPAEPKMMGKVSKSFASKLLGIICFLYP